MKVTYQDILKVFVEKGCELLTPEDEYKNMTTTLIFKCVCGKEAKTTFKTFRKPEILCRSCGAKRGRGSETYEEVKTSFEKEGCRLLSTTYINAKTPVEYICICGKESTIIYQNFKRGARCMNCYEESTSKEKISFYQNKVKPIFDKKELILFTKKDEYINKNQSLIYRCKCGTEAQVTFNNARLDSWIGCVKCSKSRFRTDYDTIFDHFDDCGCLLLTPEDEYQSNDQNLDYICSCGNKSAISWKRFRSGGRCMECCHERRTETIKERYGTDNVFQNEDIKAKSRESMMERHGVEHSMQLPENVQKAQRTNQNRYGEKYKFCQEQVKEKGRKTCLKKFGHEYPLQSDKIQKKVETTTMKNHGVRRALMAPHIHKKINEICQRRYQADYFGISKFMGPKMFELYGAETYVESEESKQRCIEKYGVPYFIVSSRFTEIMVERFGVEHAMQNPELFAKAVNNGYRMKPFVFPSGRTVYVQGYEPQCLKYLLEEEKIEEDDIKVCSEMNLQFEYSNPYRDGKTSRYYPDVYIPSRNMIIEVKSIYTYHLEEEKNDAKLEAVADAGYIAWIYLFDYKGRVIDEWGYLPSKKG